jgi:hypothetical protein
MLSRLPHRLLTLDVARLTGWAFAPIGVWTLPVADPLDHLGARIAMLEDLLGEFLEVEGVDMVVICERFPPKSITQMASGFGLDGAIRAECRRHRIPLKWQPENQIRREVYGRSGRSEDMKTAALRWCELHGIVVPDDNAAEACVLWRWSRDELVRQRLRGGAVTLA